MEEAGWWLNPYRWVDVDDLYDLAGKLSPERAIDVLKDKHVKRPADEAVMVRGVKGSVSALELTRRQQSAVDLAREAVQAGVTATVYVAAQLGINRFSAYKLLQRADMKIHTSPKMETIRDFFPVYHKRSVSEKDIKKLFNTLKIDCAGCGKHGGATARYALCRECFELYGADGERSEVTSRWLDPMIRRAWRDARRQAIEILMMSDANPMALAG